MASVSIAGKGHVGSCMLELFQDAIVYDKYLGIGKLEDLKDCEFIFVCVPTPMGDFGECDTTEVDSVLSELNKVCLSKSVVIIRSTVPVGYTDKANSRYSFDVIFQPEYYGETYKHPFANPHNRSWITLGGDELGTSRVAKLYQNVFTSDIIIHQTDAKTAELAKYMENCFYATKVTFCNQFYDIANKVGVDYNKLRETWLLDPRVGSSHTFVYEDNRGFGGSCLPKDLSAMIYQADTHGVFMPLLDSVQSTNRVYKFMNDINLSDDATYRDIITKVVHAIKLNEIDVVIPSTIKISKDVIDILKSAGYSVHERIISYEHGGWDYNGYMITWEEHK